MPPPSSAWMRISELSRRVGVSVETLRAWERRYGVLRPRRSTGNTRLYCGLDEARVRIMQRYIGRGLPVAQAAELAMTAPIRLHPGTDGVVPSHEAARGRAELAAALDAFDETSADRTLAQLLTAFGPLAVLRAVIVPHLHEIGERWAADHMSVAQEHFASNFILARLHALARGWDRGLGPQALLAAAPGDYHTLGLLCFGISLHRLGWRILFLGGATPAEMLAETCRRVGPAAVVLSASLAGALEPHVRVVSELAEHTTVAVGGPATDPEVAAGCRATFLPEPVAAAESLALAVRPPGGRAVPIG